MQCQRPEAGYRTIEDVYGALPDDGNFRLRFSPPMRRLANLPADKADQWSWLRTGGRKLDLVTPDPDTYYALCVRCRPVQLSSDNCADVK